MGHARMRKRCLGLPGMGTMRFPTMRSRAFVPPQRYNCWLRKEYVGFGIGGASLYGMSVHQSPKSGTVCAGRFHTESREVLSLREQMEKPCFWGCGDNWRVGGRFRPDVRVECREIYGRQLEKYDKKGC